MPLYIFCCNSGIVRLDEAPMVPEVVGGGGVCFELQKRRHVVGCSLRSERYLTRASLASNGYSVQLPSEIRTLGRHDGDETRVS